MKKQTNKFRLNKKDRKVEDLVQKVYRKVNPTLSYIEKNKTLYRKTRSFMEDLYLNRLNLPPQFLKGRELLEFGSGTGEYSLSYVQWGLKCTFVEKNPFAAKRSKYLFNKFSKSRKFKIHNCSLFDFKSTKKFDFVTSTGVIHHTNQKKLAFIKKCSHLKPGGFVMLGIGTASGMFQRNLQRTVIHHFAKKDEDKIYKVANYLFPKFLDRAKKIGLRSVKSIIYDNYVMHCDDHPSIHDVLKWFEQNNISFYSSWPPIKPNFVVDGPKNSQAEWLKYKNVMSFSDFAAIDHNEDDKYILNKFNQRMSKSASIIDKLTKHVMYVNAETKLNKKLIQKLLKQISNLPNSNNIEENFYSKAKIFSSEVSKLFKSLESNDLNKVKKCIDSSLILFRGNCGLGMNYFLGYKN